MHDVETAMLHYLEISTEMCVWCSANFHISYGQMVLERLKSIICISSVTKSFTAKRFTLSHPTDESKSLALVGEINLGCLIHPLLVECRSN